MSAFHPNLTLRDCLKVPSTAEDVGSAWWALRQRTSLMSAMGGKPTFGSHRWMAISI